MANLPTNQKGFSLIELSVVLSIITLITMISIPLFVNYQKNTKLRSEARILVTNLRLTQQLAVTEQIVYNLTIYPSDNEYKIINSQTSEINKTVELNPEVTINAVNNLTDNTVSFNPTGAVAQSGDIVLINTRNETSTIQIKPSGYVQIIE